MLKINVYSKFGQILNFPSEKMEIIYYYIYHVIYKLITT